MKWNKVIVLIIPALVLVCIVQPLEAQDQPDPRGAFVRSLAVPGWGHYYADKTDWNRGKLHLGAEVAMIATYAGLLHRMSNLEERYLTLASLRAGVDLDGRSRSFQLAVGDYENLAGYNDFQLRTRNWNRLFDDVADNHWQWKNEEDRNRYNELRSDRDRVSNQLPAIIGLMAVNRVVSAISAYNHARNRSIPEMTLAPVFDEYGAGGAALHIRFRL